MHQKQPRTQSGTNNIILLSLPEIAAWQIHHRSVQPNRNCMAELPALQRGAVWKPGQIEVLWDSILREFPLGAFLLSPFDSNLGGQPFLHQDTTSRNQLPRTHMLLDGQQRANGIALGFLNPWHDTTPSANVRSVLWVDLGLPSEVRDVAYVFRLVTRAHPWGYSRVDPERPVTQYQIRQSLRAFRAASSRQYDKSRPHQIPLSAVWPWDAEAPVPVSLLVEALYDSKGIVADARDLAWQAIQALAFMQAEAQEDRHWKEQQDAVRKAFKETTTRLDNILSLFWQRITQYDVPANVVPGSAIGAAIYNDTDAAQLSAVETLFIRVNSAGTPLGGEELMYSLIKSSWKDAPEAITKLTHKLATPARTALLASRLVRARHQRMHQDDKTGREVRLLLIPNFSVDDFRRLMNGQNQEQPNFSEDLKKYVEGDGMKVFEAAYNFLTKGDYGLPPVLASELAQKSPDIFFLFLRWLDRLMYDHDQAKPDIVDKIPDDIKRISLGFLTAIAWFAKSENKLRTVNAIWHELQTISDIVSLEDFFNRENYLRTIMVDNNGKWPMIPLIKPDTLELALKKKVLGYRGCENTTSKDNSPIWDNWLWEGWLIKNPGRDITKALQLVIHGEDIAYERIVEMWGQFINFASKNKSMLLYVQREWLNLWFPDFDPSLPEFLEDKNRPWDFDHIYPQKFLQSQNGRTLYNLPQVIKDWHNSIGNLRAWPLEANRSDGDTPPSIKLANASPEELTYAITDTNKLNASFITKEQYQNYWSYCGPEKDERLSNEDTFEQRKALVNAIVRRFLDIYSKWFNDLRLEELIQ